MQARSKAEPLALPIGLVRICTAETYLSISSRVKTAISRRDARLIPRLFCT